MADPTWRDRLERAAFRGFEFLTDAHDAKGGRRLVVSEFPSADIPQVEDLGTKAGEWRLNAYFLGSDYDLERNGFLARLQAPGADWLTHPWLGLLWVRAHTWSVHESNDRQGFCTVSVDFVEGGESLQPVPDAVDVAWEDVQAVARVMPDAYKPRAMSASELSQFLAKVNAALERVRAVIALARLPLTWAHQVMGMVATIKGDLASLAALPGAYGAALGSLCDALGGGADEAGLADTNRPRVVGRLAALAAGGSLSRPGAVLAVDGASPALRFNLVQEAVLRQGLLATAAAGVALTTYRTAEDRDAALGAVLAAFDALLPYLADAPFQAVLTARASVAAALLAQDLAPAVVLDVANPLPGVVLAYQLGVDAEAFLARNAVRHPLFVQGRVHG